MKKLLIFAMISVLMMSCCPDDDYYYCHECGYEHGYGHNHNGPSSATGDSYEWRGCTAWPSQLMNEPFWAMDMGPDIGLYTSTHLMIGVAIDGELVIAKGTNKFYVQDGAAFVVYDFRSYDSYSFNITTSKSSGKVEVYCKGDKCTVYFQNTKYVLF